MSYVITEACIGVLDRACAAVCPVDCIYEGGEILYINPDECIVCTACQLACPVGAIYRDTDLPEELRHWLPVAKGWFAVNSAPIVAQGR